MRTYTSLKIVSQAEDENARVKVGQYEFEKARPKLTTIDNMAWLGEGIAYFKGGEYKGYHMLSEETFRLSIEEIVKTREFKKILKELNLPD